MDARSTNDRELVKQPLISQKIEDFPIHIDYEGKNHQRCFAHKNEPKRLLEILIPAAFFSAEFFLSETLARAQDTHLESDNIFDG